MCELADSKAHMILGRHQALRMKYVDFPEIQEPAVNAKPEKAIKAVQKAVTEPVRPVIQESADSSITINGKPHQLPTRKEYMLKEYADVFEGIWTLPGEK